MFLQVPLPQGCRSHSSMSAGTRSHLRTQVAARHRHSLGGHLAVLGTTLECQGLVSPWGVTDPCTWSAPRWP